jgi:hypothetical protein
VVTINTAGTAPTAYTERLIIAASACTDDDRTQDIAIYTKTANEGIANVRVRWGSSKFNYAAAAPDGADSTVFYFGVGFHPTGGSLDDDSMILQRDIAGVSAGDFVLADYYTYGGAEWGPNSYWHRYMHQTLAHYQTAGVVSVNILLAAGKEVSDITSGTIEVFLDIVDPGAGTTIS